MDMKELRMKDIKVNDFNTHICKYCNEGFRLKYSYNQHLMSVHHIPYRKLKIRRLE
jgi:hypothetical protein